MRLFIRDRVLPLLCVLSSLLLCLTAEGWADLLL